MGKSCLLQVKNRNKQWGINCIAESIDNIGYESAAKEIRKAKSPNEVKKHTDWVLNRELKVGRGCEYLTDPITRKRTPNPMRKKYVLLKDMTDKAITMIDDLPLK